MTVRKTYDGAYFKALNDDTGEFEAVVSIFGNVDLQGDRVLPGAFTKSLEEWRRSGDPIPVIWSHQWGDPEAHIGYVMPDDALEIVDEAAKAFGEGITGGLYVKGKLDVHKPFAAQVYDLLKERRVREWSFAYDIVDEERAKDGANNLKVVGLHEVGPTLKGANPSTFTLGVKSALEEAARLDRGLKKVTRALDVDSEVGMKMLRDWVREDLSAEDSALEMKMLKDWALADQIVLAFKNDREVGKKMLLDWMDEEEQKEAGEKWDGPAAMRTCDSAADFRKIAFERNNDSDPDTAAHWTLPHHPSPGAGPDQGGVSAALGRLNQVSDLKPSVESVRNHLERHQTKSEEDPAHLVEEPTEKSVSDEETKALGVVDGSVEERQRALFNEMWSEGLSYWPVATFEDRVVVGAYDESGDEIFLEIPYTFADGKVELGEGKPVDIETVIVPKSQFWNPLVGRSQTKAGRVIGAKAASSLKDALTKAVDDFVATVNGTTDPEPEKAKDEADKAKSEQDEESEKAKAELEEYKARVERLLGS